MRFQTLSEWLDWQQQLHPKDIELGLDRVKKVFERLSISPIAKQIITIAGTNGKGSTVAYYETWLKNAGLRVGSYTSPHLLNYNERIRIDTKPVSDNALMQAFSEIDRVRDQTKLTYFEFGTLAAMYLMTQQKVDVAILEVGLGGRLDAVNIVDASLAQITPIGLDHQDWLGDNRDQIGLEKAGILREQGLAVYNDPDPTTSIIQQLKNLKCNFSIYSKDYNYRWLDDQFIEWSSGDKKITLQPPLTGDHQALNISGVLEGLKLLGHLNGLSEQEVRQNFNGVKCFGRLQQIETSLPAQVWVDVGHNEDAARVISRFLQQKQNTLQQGGKVIVLMGMLTDKQPQAFVEQLESIVDEWWLLGLNCERGLSAPQLEEYVNGSIKVSRTFNHVEQSVEHAMSSLNNKDILLVTGSFYSVEAFLKTSQINFKT